ncbi:MAG: glycosyltransferase [Phycisphaerae bacterium]
MSPGAVIFVAIECGLCIVWTGLLIWQYRARRGGLFLSARPYCASADCAEQMDIATVCVVVPARNEAADLASCMTSILSQDYPALSLLLVDDRSEDETAAIAESFAHSDPRVRVERIETLPPGWMAKSHALWRAARLARSDWLLFIDVDCRLEPSAVTTVVEEARRRGVEMLSLWPRQACGGFWEHLLIPLCAGIIALWYGGIRVHDPTGGPAFANGQFLLIRREAYDRIGGHQSVRAAIIEDIPLAEQAKRFGVPRHVASGIHLFSVRMYKGYREILDGWARIYVGSLRSGTRITLGILWLLAGSWLPHLALLVLIGKMAIQATPDAAISDSQFVFLGLTGLHLVLLYIASYRFWAMGGCPRRYLLLYPLSVFIVMRILSRAWWWLIIRGTIEWRENHYTIDHKGRIVV